MHSHIGCICLAFLHYVFSNVSSKRLHKRMQSHIDYICLTLLCLSHQYWFLSIDSFQNVDPSSNDNWYFYCNGWILTKKYLRLRIAFKKIGSETDCWGHLIFFWVLNENINHGCLSLTTNILNFYTALSVDWLLNLWKHELRWWTQWPFAVCFKIGWISLKSFEQISSGRQ